MRTGKVWLHLGTLFIASLAAFAPIQVQGGRGLAKPVAECETCCSEATSHCVVCGTRSCIDATNYYEAKIGSPCSQQHDLDPL